MPARGTAKRPNIVLLGIDSIRRDHMSCYGYWHQTTPHIDKFAEGATLFEYNFSPHIPTTPAYASMLTGMDCFSTEVVALRHPWELTDKVQTLAELLREQDYDTTCVGFSGNPSARGFDTYLNYPAWGSWDQGPSPKAEKLNEVALPELERLAAGDKPFFLFLRHMDPHAPYLPPPPFDTLFYAKDATEGPDTMGPVRDFKPFGDFHLSWMPPGIQDIDYVTGAYDGAVAYMDACIQRIFTRLEELGLAEDTIVALNGDHGETLDEHDCYFDHHGMYEPTLVVPLIIRYPGVLPAGERVYGTTLHQDLVPTLLDLAGIEPDVDFDGRSLLPMVAGEVATHYSEFYITEATWMRKHGWRTMEWKLIRSLEPDFHFKPAVELYNLHDDPLEEHNVADDEPAVVDFLTERMESYIEGRKQAKNLDEAPIVTAASYWNGHGRAFESSQEAYDTLYIGSASQAQKLQAGKKDGAAADEEE